MTDLPLDQVRTLLAAVDEGTFDAAARVLHVTPSAVSQRVKALEQQVGRILLLRTKPIRATESGEVVIRFARQLARLERDASAELGLSDAQDGEPSRLSIAVNADSLATWFLPALAAVSATVNACFDLYREDQDLTGRLLQQGQVSAAVTSSSRPVQGCTVHELGRMRYRAMAAPEFVARRLSHGPLAEVLADAPVVVFDREDDLQDAYLRALAPGHASPTARHHIPDSVAYVEAVAAGLGWGMVSHLQAATRLVDLSPGRHLDIPLFWQQWKLDSPVLAAVADAVARAAALSLLPVESAAG